MHHPAVRSRWLRTLAAVFGAAGGAAVAMLSTQGGVPLISALWAILLFALFGAVLVRLSMFVTERIVGGRYLDWPLVVLLLLAWFAAGTLIAGVYSEGSALASFAGGLTFLLPSATVAVGHRAHVQAMGANPHAPSVVLAGSGRRLDAGLRRCGLGEGAVSGLSAFATAALILHWRWTGLGLLGLALLVLTLQCFAAVADRAWARLFAKARAVGAVFAGFCAGAGVVMALFAVLALSGFIEDRLFMPFMGSRRNPIAAFMLWIVPSLVACAVTAVLTRQLPASRTRLAAVLLTGTALGAAGSSLFLRDLRVDVQGPSPVPFLGLLPALLFTVSAIRIGRGRNRADDPSDVSRH